MVTQQKGQKGLNKKKLTSFYCVFYHKISGIKINIFCIL